jgi:hypothetical protein
MAPRSSRSNPATLFYSYSHKDERMRDQLAVHLAILSREGVIKEWHDRDIGAGDEWEGAIDESLEKAEIILLLVSPDFVASDYCWSKEMTRALEQHDAGKARVIPIILRPVDWNGAPFGRLQALPKNAKPITVWSNRNLAWVDVVRGIRKTAADLSAGIPPTSEKLPARVPPAVTKRPQAPAATPAPRKTRRPRKALRRAIHSAENRSDFPGKVVRSEGDPPTGDAAVDEAYDGLGVCYEFFWDVFARSSVDGKGKPIEATVHYERSYNNAFWSGKGCIFGDGDGTIFNRFTSALDVIAHTFAHGVVGAMVRLDYWEQSGALMESVCDVFGTLVKQYQLRQTADQADWLIGSGLFAPGVHGVALRSMASPGTAYDDATLGKDPQPAHMRAFVRTDTDNGGVHINSGIPSRAFYLAAASLGGFAWERAGRIWYDALPTLPSAVKFHNFAQTTAATVRQLYGGRSDELLAVKHAWQMVGVRMRS